MLFAQLVDDPSSLPDQFPTFEEQVISSFPLSSRKGKVAWIEPVVDKGTITYRIRHDGTKEELAKAKEGTKAGAHTIS